ncbi:hypothetical protein D9M69_686170 [compost metagenome]
MFEQRQPAGTGHAHIEQHTAGIARRIGPARDLGQEGVGAVKALAEQPPRPQQPGQRFAHARIVIDEKDLGVGVLGHGRMIVEAPRLLDGRWRQHQRPLPRHLPRPAPMPIKFAVSICK